MKRASVPERAAAREIAAVVAAAALVRIAYLLAFRSSPFFAAPILDSARHDGLARLLASGVLDAGAPYFRPPLFPWLLGAAYAVAGAGPWPGRILNAVLGASAAWAVLLAGARMGLSRGRRVAAALAVALYAPEIFLEGELVGEPLAMALTAWGLLAAVRAGSPAAPEPRGRPRWGSWIAAAALWALAGLARAPLALLVPALALLAALTPGRRLLRAGAVAATAAALWAGPAAIMAAHGAGFRFPATQGGINFYIGNHPGADGRSVDAPAVTGVGGWRDFAEASVRAASRGAGRPLTSAQASSWWTERGLEFWRERPAAALRLTALRALYLVHGYEAPNNRSLYEARRDVPWFPALLWRVPFAYWPSGVLFPLALAGLVFVRRRREWAPAMAAAAVILLPLLVFFVCARFRAPALPALALLAAAGAGGLGGRRPRRWALVAGLYLAANAPWPGAIRSDPPRDALARAEALLDAGRTAAAVRDYRAVLALDPAEGRAHLGLAVAAERTGDSARALAEADSAAALLPGSWEAEFTRARILRAAGRREEAAEAFRRAAADFPEDPGPWAELGLTLETLGRDAGAREALEKAAARGSRDPEVWNSAGRYRRLAGDAAGALAAWNRALELDPHHFKARFNRGLARAERGEGAAALSDLRRALSEAPDAASAEKAREAIALVERRLP